MADSSPPADDGEQGESYITKEMLGESCNLMVDVQPDWKFEVRPDEWQSYPPQNSIELDRYWKVFDSKNADGSTKPHLATVFIKGKKTLMDFEAMTSKVGDFPARKLRRDVVDDGWLTNAFFFNCFTAVLASAGVKIDCSPEDMFDFRFNQDFRKMKDDGRKTLKRGNQIYKIPVGWKRFAVKVKGNYDDGDNSWLKEDDSGWAVAYHGTSKDSLPSIMTTGFRIGPKQKFASNTGAGIYCTPEHDVAQYYAEPQLVEGKWVQTVLQMRVKPSAIKKVTASSAREFEKKYWVINDPQDMRAYGVLMRELSLYDYKPPQYAFLGASNSMVVIMLDELKEKAEALERGDPWPPIGEKSSRIIDGGSQPGGCCCVL